MSFTHRLARSLRLHYVAPTVLGALVVLLGLAGQMSSAPAWAANPWLPAEIRVALHQNTAQITLGATAPYQVVNAQSGQMALLLSSSEQIQLRSALGLIYVNDQGPYYGPLQIRLVDELGGRLSIAGRQYRGWLEASIGSDGQLLLVNQVGLEDYLQGVVPREMPASWHPEALKAQAVAARTYAVSQIRASQAAGSRFAVVATTDSQVYGGSTGEVASTNLAVQQTRGMILTYQGQPITAVYHASSGGHTENSEIVWTSALPYLRGVPDFDQWSPRYSWEIAMTMEEVARRLGNAGYDIGLVLAIERTGPVGVSGRTHSLTFRGTDGTLELRSEAGRRALGLWSTLFEVSITEEHEGIVVTGLPAGREVVVAGAAAGAVQTVSRSVGQSFSIGAEGVLYRMPRYTVVHKAHITGAVVFTGGGWGHGVGMSQHGAYQLARDGKTFAQILAHYYPGAVLEQR